jgi:hypothetical protein
MPIRTGVLVLQKLDPDELREAERAKFKERVDLAPYRDVLREASGGEWLKLDPQLAGLTPLALRKRVSLAAKSLGLDLQWGPARDGVTRVWFRLT